MAPSLLLETHALLWWLVEPEKLSTLALEAAPFRSGPSGEWRSPTGWIVGSAGVTATSNPHGADARPVAAARQPMGPTSRRSQTSRKAHRGVESPTAHMVRLFPRGGWILIRHLFGKPPGEEDSHHGQQRPLRWVELGNDHPQ